MTKSPKPAPKNPSARNSKSGRAQASKSNRSATLAAGKRKTTPTASTASPASFDASKPLANARHELFAQEVAKGSSAEAAYSTAGFSPNSGNPYRLKENERVSARIAWLLASAAEKTAVTVETVTRELASIAFDRSGGTRKADRVSALHLLGRHVGMFPTKIALGGDPDAPAIKTEAQVKAEIEAKIELDAESLAALVSDLRKGL